MIRRSDRADPPRGDRRRTAAARLGVVLASLTLPQHPAQAQAQEEAGRPAWVLEHFGQDVSILRTRREAEASGGPGFCCPATAAAGA